MIPKQRRSILFMLAGLAVLGLAAGLAFGAGSSSTGLQAYDVTLTPNYVSPLDDRSSNYQGAWIYPTSPTTPYRSPDSQHHVGRYLLLDPRYTDSDGRRGNDEWWFIVQRFWSSSYPASNHGDWGREVNFHNVAGDAGPTNSGGVGWGFGSGVSSFALDWTNGAPSPAFALEPNHPNESLPLPPAGRNTWHTYVVHYIAGRTDGTTVRPGAVTVWADGASNAVINLTNVNTVQRAQGPDGNSYTQRWMQLWEGDYTRGLPTTSTVRLALTRVGRTLPEAVADRPVSLGTNIEGQYYSGSGVNVGAPSVRDAGLLSDADAAIPASLGGAGATPSAGTSTTSPTTTTATTPTTTTTARTTTTTPKTTTPKTTTTSKTSTATSTTASSQPSTTAPSGSRADSSPASSGSASAPAAAKPAAKADRRISLWWDGVHFARWSTLKAHVQARGVEPNAFLLTHPTVVKMLAASPLQWDTRQFFVKSSLAEWLRKRGAEYPTWAKRHSDAAARLML